MHGRAWAVVCGRARSCVRGRSCVVVRGRACMVGHSWLFVVVRGRARSVVRGRAQSVVRGRAVLPASRPALPCCPLRGQHGSDTNERTTYNNPLNPLGWGGSHFFNPIKVRVSMGTCVPNLGAIRRPVRKFCLSNL